MKKSIYLLAFMTSLMIGSVPAWAAWEKVEVDGNGDTSYVDSATVRRYGSHLKIFALRDSRQPEKIGNDSYRSIKAEIEVECEKGEVRVLFLSIYADRMGTGTIVRSGKVDDEWAPIEGDSPNASLSKIVCNIPAPVPEKKNFMQFWSSR